MTGILETPPGPGHNTEGAEKENQHWERWAKKRTFVRALEGTARLYDATVMFVAAACVGMCGLGQVPEGGTGPTVASGVTVIRPEDFHARLADRVDVVLLAEDARLPLEGLAGGY